MAAPIAHLTAKGGGRAIGDAEMRILALCHGLYGNRIAEHVRQTNGDNWKVYTVSLPRRLPLVIDEPEEFVPADIPRADLVLAMGESPESAQLLPCIVARAGARAVIAPVDNSAWLPPGLKNQLRLEIARLGVASVFPRTFCTLTETSCGFAGDTEGYEDEMVASFAARFGRPRIRLRLDSQKRIVGVDVDRSAPCGSTHLVASKLAGVPAADAVPQAGLHAHHYPCLASMAMEANGETLMHISGHVVNEEIVRRLRES